MSENSMLITLLTALPISSSITHHPLLITVFMKRIILRLLITATIGIVGYLLLWPVPIDPVAWDPPPAPELTGVYAQNNELAKTVRLAVNHHAPEDVAFDKQDRIYTGADDGYIYRLQPDGTSARGLHPHIRPAARSGVRSESGI